MKQVMLQSGPVTVLLLALSILLLPGCAMHQPADRIDYYTLEYETAPAPAVAELLPVVLRIERFSAAPDYRTDRMVYREADFKRAEYYYHRWRNSPADLVTYFLARDLRRRGSLQGVVAPGSVSAATHVLEGEVEEFIEWDGASGCEARLAVQVTLLTGREPDPARRVLLQKRFEAVEKCDRREPVAVARAMSTAMGRLSAAVEQAVAAALR